jgi:hypothetical protein
MEAYLADHLIKEEIECDTGAFRRPLSGISKVNRAGFSGGHFV